MSRFFRRFLADRRKDHRLGSFARDWDALEALVIEVYRQGEASLTQERHYQRLRLRLTRGYPKWAPDLEVFWQAVKIGSQRLQKDPFAEILAPRQAQAFVENWAAMQTLPAAREALNLYMLEEASKHSNTNH